MELDFFLFNQLDWIIIAIFLVLLTWHMTRGVIKTLISLVVWLLAFIIAKLAAYGLQDFLAPYITDSELLILFPFFFVFVFVLLFLNLVTSFFRLDIDLVKGAVGRLLAFCCSLPLIIIQILVLTQLAYLLAFNSTEYWYFSQLTTYVLDLESFWNTWILEPLCSSLLRSSCVGL